MWPVSLILILFVTLLGGCRSPLRIVPLQETLHERSGEGPNADVRYTVSYFAPRRALALGALVSRYRLESPDAIVEWGGGLSKYYEAAILVGNTVYRYSWKGSGVERFERVELSNESKRAVTHCLAQLRNLRATPSGVTCDADYLFVTFYAGGRPLDSVALLYEGPEEAARDVGWEPPEFIEAQQLPGLLTAHP